MSRPISTCWVSKASLGDKAALETLIDAMDYNWACGHWSQMPCECNPPCPIPSEDQLKTLDQLVRAGVAQLVEKRKADMKAKGLKMGSFEKIIFPAIKNMPKVDILDIFSDDNLK
jgi:hypothetical protein